MNLEECRARIDQIDEQLLTLYIERMHTVIEVAKYKKEHNLPIFHPTREKEIIEKHTQNTPDELKPYVKALYETLMETSRSYQNKLIK